jgi:flagellar motility protein MotE (MotC chaperone)
MVGIKKDLIEKNVKALVKAYSNMKPVQAAALLERMDEGIAIIIISRMKSRVAGKVLGAMNTRIAKGISEKIAGKKDNPN